jgi:hypothetical protein
MNDPIAKTFSDYPEAFMALLKAQAILKQRREDEDKPKAIFSVRGLTREQAQRLADELCTYAKWGEEIIEPKMNI